MTGIPAALKLAEITDLDQLQGSTLPEGFDKRSPGPAGDEYYQYDTQPVESSP